MTNKNLTAATESTATAEPEGPRQEPAPSPVEGLAARVRELGGTFGATADFDETAEPRDYIKRLMAWETAPGITHRGWLARHGLVFDPPERVAPGQMSRELWRLIESLAFARVFLYGTDHLGDAELYARLWHDVLGAEEPDVPRHMTKAFHWDLSIPGDEGGERTWLTYYATEDERADWAEDFPGSPLPPHQPCVCPREDLLPKRD